MDIGDLLEGSFQPCPEHLRRLERLDQHLRVIGGARKRCACPSRRSMRRIVSAVNSGERGSGDTSSTSTVREATTSRPGALLRTGPSVTVRASPRIAARGGRMEDTGKAAVAEFIGTF